jgi:hypothetical protein
VAAAPSNKLGGVVAHELLPLVVEELARALGVVVPPGIRAEEHAER